MKKQIPLCQNCGCKIYSSYGMRGYLATPEYQYDSEYFNTTEEFNNFSPPENALDIDRHTYHNGGGTISWKIPQESRDGLFHNRFCFEQWHLKHRDELESLIKNLGEWKSP
tara:strand:- start:2 stop:334 length:333 start_codon:yes stop_codon:yes gene_type:complete